jgi:hypothetical protein
MKAPQKYCQVDGCGCAIPSKPMVFLCRECWDWLSPLVRDAYLKEWSRLSVEAANDGRVSTWAHLNLLKSRAVAEVEDKKAGLIV